MLIPVKRYIVVELPPKREEISSDILLPDSYAPRESSHAACTVLEFASDVRFDMEIGDTIIVDRSMIEEIQVDNETYSVVLDNYVIGLLHN